MNEDSQNGSIPRKREMGLGKVLSFAVVQLLKFAGSACFSSFIPHIRETRHPFLCRFMEDTTTTTT